MLVNERIKKETKELLKNKTEGFIVKSVDNNPRYFKAIIDGPRESPYEEGHFKLELYLPEKYPMVPPKCLYIIKVYHPNIDYLGRISLDILKNNWSPALQIRSVLLSIQTLLDKPNTEDPLNIEVNKRWIENKSAAEQTARDWTKSFAQ